MKITGRKLKFKESAGITFHRNDQMNKKEECKTILMKHNAKG